MGGSTINEKWHSAHEMPKNPTMDERVNWHLEHARECACRPIPESIEKEIKRRARRA
jgi:hypothetical protein